MHLDLDQIKDHVPSRKSFCILGAGIAGLVLAQRLARMGYEVTLLEGGGLDFEERSQNLYDSEMARARHTGTTLGRFRTFGGSSTRWGAQLLPYTQDVFKPVSTSPSTPWPIDETDISSYYDEVQSMMHVGTLPFTDALLTELKLPPSPFSTRIRLRYSKWAPFSKRNLAKTLGQTCLTDSRISLYTHANVAELVVEAGRVAYARVFDYNGRPFQFHADKFILAAGTIESSRILLSSKTLPDPGDQLGRFFHDHVSFPAAIVPPEARKRIVKRLGPFFINNVLHTCKLEAAPELQLQENLLSTMAHFVIQEPEDSGISAVRNLLFSLQQGNFKKALTVNLGPMFRGLGDVLRLVWDSKILKRRSISKKAVLRLNIDMEQPPSRDNRIRLSQTRDALGLPKAVVDWQIGRIEADNAVKFARIMKRQLEDAGISPLNWTAGLLEGQSPEMVDTYHAMGGLRMGLDPASSVVDQNLKVHHAANLYVASCAVFPSGGSSNPTFTMMALTMRLADHLCNRKNLK